jgi:hypothetical protein
MSLRRDRGHNMGAAIVVLPDNATAVAAAQELQGAPLFDGKVQISMGLTRRKLNPFVNMPTLNWGWTATNNPDLSKVLGREILRDPPKDLFAPIREGKRLVFDNVPTFPGESLNLEVVKGFKTIDFSKPVLYKLLFSYNVTWVGYSILYQRKNDKQTVRAMNVDFATRDEAEHARLKFNEFNWYGNIIGVAPWQVPMKHLGVSWDSGRKARHFSGRDQGSAVGTNFEEVHYYHPSKATRMYKCTANLRLQEQK